MKNPASQEIYTDIRRLKKQKMKTKQAKLLSILAISVLMFSLMGTAVLADDAEDAFAGEQGLSTAEVASAVADDNVESSSGIFGDKVRAVFAANAEKKAEIKAKIAAKKMQKLKEIASENPEKAKALAKAYEDELDSVFEELDKIAVDGEKEEVIHALRSTVIMKYKLETHMAKWSQVHLGILEKQTEKMTEEQIAHLEEVFSATEEKINEKISRIEERQENLIARLVALGMSEEEIRAKLEAFENSLKEKVDARKAKFDENKQKVELKKDEIRARLKTPDGEFKAKIKDKLGSKGPGSPDSGSDDSAEDDAIVLN